MELVETGPAVAYTAACPSCGADTEWTATLLEFEDRDGRRRQRSYLDVGCDCDRTPPPACSMALAVPAVLAA